MPEVQTLARPVPTGNRAASSATEQMRVGSRTLSIFANALSARVLRAHAAGPLRPGDLEEAISWAPQSSLRLAVGNLCDRNALVKTEPAGGSQGVVTELTPAGNELLPVAVKLERWLSDSPDGPISLDDDAARGIVRVLVAGWDSTMIRTLAERPLSLAELNDGISSFSHPALKRRLAKLRSTRLVTRVGAGKTVTCAATDWLRRAVVPLTVAGRWELRHDPDAEPISPVEAEAVFLLALPLIELTGRASGTCTLAVLSSDHQPGTAGVAGVAVEVDGGRIVSCDLKSASAPATWALGTGAAWFDAVIEGDSDTLRLGGAKPRLACRIVKSIHDILFRGQ